MSLTVGSIVTGIGSSISGIAEGAISIIKIVASVAIATIFAGAIISLLGLIQSVVFTGVVGEFFAIVSMCLPFNPVTVFSAIWLICEGILAFLIARKVYQLTSDLIGVSH